MILRPGAVLLLALAVTACRRDAPAPVEKPAPGPASTTTAAERSVAPSPAVTSLLKEDPDLTATMSPEEVKAAMESARSGAPPAAASQAEGLSTPEGGEWEKLEREQKEKRDAHRRTLETTSVQAGPDGAYHAGGCEVLYEWILQPDKTLQRVYVGRPLSLANALDRGMPRHAECGPPTGEFRY